MRQIRQWPLLLRTGGFPSPQPQYYGTSRILMAHLHVHLGHQLNRSRLKREYELHIASIRIKN